MILAFISELDELFLKEQGDKNYFTLHGLIMKNEDIVSEENSPSHDKTGTENTSKSPEVSTPSVSNHSPSKPEAKSFEAKYLQFKDRIEKDRLAWEILANRK
jgi:hypothetical protein